MTKTLYANMINLSGLYSMTPIEVYYQSETKLWWDKSGNFCVGMVGLDERGGITVFSDKDYGIAKAWTYGVISAMNHLNRWSTPHA